MRGIYKFILVTALLFSLPRAEARKHGNWGPGPISDQGQGSASGGSAYDVDLSKLPPCLDERGNRIDPNNEQVLQWKTTTPNQFQARALIVGTLVGVFDAKPDHVHADVFIGEKGKTGKDNDLEVIYNQSFGRVNRSDLVMGSTVVACGDYITSIAQSRYPPSPLGAVLHWIHKSMNEKHPSGFLMIDGKLFGQQDAPPRGQNLLESSEGDLFEGLWNN